MMLDCQYKLRILTSLCLCYSLLKYFTGDFHCLVHNSIEEDNEHTIADYMRVNGEYFLKSDITEPTQEEQGAKRAQAYLLEVDIITSHINRLRDESEPDKEMIAELLQERELKVQEIKERYPYPVETEEAV